MCFKILAFWLKHLFLKQNFLNNIMTKLRIQYDRNWKQVVTELIDPFIAFFLPDLYAEIDWGFPPEFLEKELYKTQILKKNKRELDKLVKVKLKSGEEKWIFIHIEFQTNGAANIGMRMYEYYELIRERYGKEIVALVVYTGDRIPKNPNSYTVEYFGTSITYCFNFYAVCEQTEAELLNNPNPFALIVLANWYVLQSKNDDEKRYSFKAKVYELAKNRGYSFEYSINLLMFVVYLMRLPQDLEQKFEKEIISPNYYKEKKMRKYSQSSYSIVNNAVRDLYGATVEELKAEAAAKAEAAVKAEAAAKAEAALLKSIILLHDKIGLSMEEIAEHLQIEATKVKRLLQQSKN